MMKLKTENDKIESGKNERDFLGPVDKSQIHNKAQVPY